MNSAAASKWRLSVDQTEKLKIAEKPKKISQTEHQNMKGLLTKIIMMKKEAK